MDNGFIAIALVILIVVMAVYHPQPVKPLALAMGSVSRQAKLILKGMG